MHNCSYLPVDDKLKSELLNVLCGKKTAVKIYLDRKLIESDTVEVSKGNKIFITYFQEPTDAKFSNTPEVECHFSINQDMYFFKGKPTYSDNTLIFTLPPIVYKIQRRENFRVIVPPSTLQSVEIITEKNSKIILNNLSLTGGQITIKNADVNLSLDRFKLNGLLKLKVTMLDFNGQVFNCVIKFVQACSRTGSTVCGVQFQNLDSARTQELQNVIAKLDRLNRQFAA